MRARFFQQPAGPESDAAAPALIPKTESSAAVQAFNERARKGMDCNDLLARLRALGKAG